ncbi:hypothetical protein NW756_009251 [Fusarium oxysporum]|nr:hypothetical protein NW753_013593 [Fusarium oxysporum]KAJ4041815.1 hypothetical protein NW763_012139 [Fusarium oxysporum]KAJ4084385.1 hypothetical protein NW756_009251 [Fusarium oxysporum]KAJ4108048.1 hypothetical protein NW769_009016 [Fusarium oxysporum]KAJ4226834.1 hypothetical protein NW760_008901 [Fusarium oxysporum]
MPQTNTKDYDDEAIRPPDSDTRIGWAGVPLSQTCGYYGHIKRAVLPTNSELGFTPDYGSVDAAKVAEEFIHVFAKAVEAQDVDAILSAVHENGYWKDVELLTWDIRTLQGHDQIGTMLTERLSKTAITNIRLNPHVPATVETLGPDLSFILLHLEFDFAHGTGVGVARLSPLKAKTGTATDLADAKSWMIYSVGTAIETVHGWDAEYGDKERYQAGKYHDPLGKSRTYQQIRDDEAAGKEGFQPTVVIIGAGHTGLSMAARCKVLGIPHLIIEKGDGPGCSWASRYASLSLHGPTFTNHLPYLPFPHWFPVFLPAQQLAKFLKNYANIMDLNIWANSTLDGKTAVYDEDEGKWTLTVTRQDGTKHILHPRHLMIATGISGTLPNIPEVPGMNDFRQNGGMITHSSHHRTDPEWKGKRAIVVGAATSGHDISFELTENGCDVTMIQRSATHVMSVEKSVRHLWKSREKTGRREGQDIDILDQANFLKHSYPVEYEVMPRGQKIAREIDADLLQSLRDVGYRLHDGYHGGGAYSMFPFDQGGFYWDTGCCKLIADGKIKLVHSEIEHFTKDGVKYKNGSSQKADIVVFATGYMNSKSAIQALLGEEMAKKCHERWEKGNAFFLGPEGDSIINYCPLPQKGLYAMFHQFAFCRFHSARLALRIKAEELGIDVTPYGNKPLGPPSTAAGQQPRPEGVSL